MRTRTRRLALASTVIAVAGGASLPAFAASSGSSVPVPVTAITSVGQRTLGLTDGAGGALDGTHGFTLQPGKTTSVVANVADAGYSYNNFQVTGTMSNLYTQTANSYNFGGPSLPSSSVSLSRSPVPLSIQAVSANLTPVFQLTGNLTSALPLTSLLGFTPLHSLNITGSGLSVPGNLQNIVTLAGSTVDATLAGLPLSIAGGTEGAFTNPQGLGVGDPAATSVPTTIQLIGSTKSATALSSLTSSLTSALGANPTLTSLTGGATPAINSADVVSALTAYLGVPVNLVTANLPAILNALTPVLQPLTGTGITTINGQYSGSNVLTVTPPANAVTGTYKGLLTVTLADTP